MVEGLLLAALAGAGSDPLCSGHGTFSAPNTLVDGFEIDGDTFLLEIEVEGAAVGCVELARVVTSFWGRVDTGYVWIHDLCRRPSARPGERMIVLLDALSEVDAREEAPPDPTRDPAYGKELILSGRAAEPRPISMAATYDGVHPAPVYVAAPPRSIEPGGHWVLVDRGGHAYSHAPWYGLFREELRGRVAATLRRGGTEPTITGAPPRDGVPAPVLSVVDTLLPDWPTLELLYDDVVRVVLTHGETEGTGREGCRMVGTVYEPIRGPRQAGDALTLEVPPPWCPAGLDLDRPVTWVAVLEPAVDPVADARVVELVPLEPERTWATTNGQDPVYARTRPACARPPVFQREMPNTGTCMP